MGFWMLGTITVRGVLLGNAVENMLLMKMMVLFVTAQLLLFVRAPPKEEVAVAVHAPLLIERSLGSVIRTPPPAAKGFLTVKVKLYVVIAETVYESAETEAETRELGLIVKVAFPLA